ncbi:hypothetical protein VST7929_01297 [Vibrio stylophorae]|uniref:Knr4/Smi1-like domain-containing protein n=1 Tax=Vibrio stylophorae TaxID=659351 RepID=A0ABM8ZSY5_9VIBR|nr:hypothetical protein [Vibrio stylophorae]CAH0533429.1 hypothetical protein VST7929_01297 [Vibrio stylophorae]
MLQANSTIAQPIHTASVWKTESSLTQILSDMQFFSRFANARNAIEKIKLIRAVPLNALVASGLPMLHLEDAAIDATYLAQMEQRFAMMLPASYKEVVSEIGFISFGLQPLVESHGDIYQGFTLLTPSLLTNVTDYMADFGWQLEDELDCGHRVADFEQGTLAFAAGEEQDVYFFLAQETDTVLRTFDGDEICTSSQLMKSDDPFTQLLNDKLEDLVLSWQDAVK